MSVQSPETEVNIKDLVLDEPISKRETLFNPDADLKASDWVNLKKVLEHISNAATTQIMVDFYSVCADAKLVDSEKFAQTFDIRPYFSQQERILGQMANPTRSVDGQKQIDFLRLAFSHRILFPDHPIDLDPELDIVKLALSIHDQSSIISFLANNLINLMYIKTINPNLVNKVIESTIYTRSWETHRLTAKHYLDSSNFMNQLRGVELLAAIRVLSEEQYQILDFKLSPAMCKKYLRQGDIGNPAIKDIFHTAVALKILSAESVGINENGLILTTVTNAEHDNAEQLPEARKF